MQVNRLVVLVGRRWERRWRRTPIALACTRSPDTDEGVRRVGRSLPTVKTWRSRYQCDGLDGSRGSVGTGGVGERPRGRAAVGRPRADRAVLLAGAARSSADRYAVYLYVDDSQRQLCLATSCATSAL